MTLFVVHLAVTLLLVGLIWVVQIVQYPQFNQIGRDQFAEYERDYQRRITIIVMPTMLLELITSILMLGQNTPVIDRPLQLVNLGLILIVWGSTLFLQVPCHRRLAEGFDPTVHERLVRTNWIRTISWTIRGLFLTGFLIEFILEVLA